MITNLILTFLATMVLYFAYKLLFRNSNRFQLNRIVLLTISIFAFTETEYIGFSATPYVKSIPVATSIGNHDLKGVAYKTFSNMPNQSDSKPATYIGNDYYFVKNGVLFLVMDSNNANSTAHRNFVKNAVKANPDVNWKVMMFQV